MNHTKRKWGRVALVVVTMTMISAPTFAQNKINLVVPYAPGGITDILARLISKKLGDELQSTVVVENKPGAGTAIGAAHVAKATPDGRTILLTTVSTTMIINPLIMEKPPYSPQDLVAVAPIASAPFVLLASVDFPASNLRDLQAMSKKGQSLDCATVGPGTTGHLTNAMFRQITGINCTDIHYKGSGPATTDVIAGAVQLYFDGLSSAVPRVKSGQLKAIVVTGGKRSPTLAHVPTAVELGFPKFVSKSTFGVVAPAKTPKATLQKLHSAISKVIADPEIRSKFSELGAEIETTAGVAEYRQQIAADAAAWKGIVGGMDLTSLR
ncbi:Bug family tripartite tricarboxylate transporter substrate binding protein [Variovorax boronicumulans]